MQISYNWLKKYVKLPDSVTAREVAEKLKMSTVEVEGIVEQGSAMENIVVGKVLSCEKHPNADKLQVCQVDAGETITIVCGGSNVVAGMLVAVAKNGAKVKWHGEGELVELKPTKIRGVESNGMICGADEISLLDRFPKREEKEIVDLTSLKSRPGTPLAEVLGLNDAIFEIDNKSLSNRPDLWGHYGIAREVAVLNNRSVGPYKTKGIKKGSGINLKVIVEDTRECPKYTAVAMSGIKIGPSPAWLQTALGSVGVRSINNVVDTTNFVMLDLGQPLHAFDAAKVADHTIVVRLAEPGESLVLLDGKERSLTDDMLVIADPKRALALAGIMGCDRGSITSETADIIIESANFDAASIRQTSTRLGLRSDSSARFEKSLDPNLCLVALERAVALVKELCPTATVASRVVEVGKTTLFTGPLEIPTSFFEKILGVAIPSKTIISILSKLGFGVKEKKEKFLVTIPSWRATKDVSRAEDIVEEVARIYGYDQIPSSLPTFPIIPPIKNELRALERACASLLVKELNYTEVYNYSFVSAAQIKRLGDDLAKYLELDNPISKEKPYIRRNLLPNLLENIAANLPEVESLRLFEMGKVFCGDEAGPRAETQSDELLPRQDTWLTVVFVNKKNQAPFGESRSVAEAVAANLYVPLTFVPDEANSLHPWQHPTRTARLMVGKQWVGRVYELHPAVATAHGISERTGVCSLNWTEISNLSASSKARAYAQLSPYPSVKRDIAFLVKKEVTHGEIVTLLRKSDPLLKKIELFDVFEGKGIAVGYKSMAYHLTYGSAERTLTSGEADTVESKIVKLLQEKFGVEVRT